MTSTVAPTPTPTPTPPPELVTFRDVLNHLVTIVTDPTALDERYRALVAAAAARLDAADPGWTHRVDPTCLDLLDPRACVLAHLYGHYRAGVDHLYGVDRDLPPFVDRYGRLPADAVAFSGVVPTEYWLVALLERR